MLFPTEATKDDKPVSAASLDDLLKLGRSAQNVGDYRSAIARYEEAVRAYPGEPRALEVLCFALRQVAISQFLIDKFLSDFGYQQKEYHGFDHIEPQLSRESVSQYLAKVVQDISEDSPEASLIGDSLKTDQFAMTGRLEAEPGDSERFTKSVFGCRTHFLCGVSAMERKALKEAELILTAVIKDNPLCSSAYLLLGRIYYRQSVGGLALLNLYRAFLYPRDFWAEAWHSVSDPVDIGEYKGYELIFYQSEFHAVPKTGEFFLCFLGGHNTLFKNRVGERGRKALLQMLPPRLVSVLRRLIHATPLRYAVLKPVSFARFLHGKNLLSIISAIERSPSDARTNIKTFA